MAKSTKDVNIKLRNPEKYEYAYMLFMQGVSQKDICTKVETTGVTLQKWKDSGGWEEKRAVRTVSIDSLITKTLKKINDLLDNPEFSADSFAKAVNQLKTLKQGASVDDKILSYMDFGDWLIEYMSIDRTITEDFVKQVTKYQDIYILRNLKNGK